MGQSQKIQFEESKSARQRIVSENNEDVETEEPVIDIPVPNRPKKKGEEEPQR